MTTIISHQLIIADISTLLLRDLVTPVIFRRYFYANFYLKLYLNDGHLGDDELLLCSTQFNGIKNYRVFPLPRLIQVI